MGGCSCEDDCGFIAPRTVVLVGKTGNGKSATGNSILGMKVLLSKRSSSGVTISSELHATTLEYGQIVKVIDTPVYWVGKEIVKCINMAQDGVDAFLFVVSTLSRFSEEEEAAISSLKTLFGRKVYDYMIVVFTGGDQLEDDDQTLEDFLCDSSEALKEALRLCGNRYVLFDNKTKDETKRSNQVKELLLLVNMVSTMNSGKPYTNEIFTEMKNQMKELREQEITADDEKFKHIYEMIESKFKETTLKLEQQLAEERAACVKTEKKAKAAKKEQDEDKQKLKQKVEKKNEELQQQKVEGPRMKEEHKACVQAEKKAKAAKKKPDEMKELPRKEDCVNTEKNAKAAKKKPDEVKELLKKEDCVNAEKKPKAAKKNPDEEIKMLKENLQKAEKKNKELCQQRDELRRKEEHRRQREEGLRIAGFGCFIM